MKKRQLGYVLSALSVFAFAEISAAQVVDPVAENDVFECRTTLSFADGHQTSDLQMTKVERQCITGPVESPTCLGNATYLRAFLSDYYPVSHTNVLNPTLNYTGFSNGYFADERMFSIRATLYNDVAGQQFSQRLATTRADLERGLIIESSTQDALRYGGIRGSQDATAAKVECNLR